MISKPEFITRVKELKSFKSKTGNSYSDLSLVGNILSFKRASTGEYWKLSIEEVYKIYLKENYFNTVVIRMYMNGRVYSPSLGLLMATGLCDEEGNRKNK